MFQDTDLQNHLETSSTIKTQSAIVAEWNMNIPTNILQIGNYRYRPTDPESLYKNINPSFDENDINGHYTDATDSDITVDGGIDEDDQPQVFKSVKDKMKLLYSLEDCFGVIRPRSGINKAVYLNGKYVHHSNLNMSTRPRYYMADKNDTFKYWTSFRTENSVERGIANNNINGNFYIDDTAPYVVYKDQVPSNRVVIKMQTNVGSTDLGPFSTSAGTFSDPLYGDANQTTPQKWKVQFLKNNNWVDAISFNKASVRKDGTKIIKSDGYVELAYGLIVPDKYRDIFIYAEDYNTITFLPEKSIVGYAYLIKNSQHDIGTFHIWTGEAYETFVPTYGWYLQEETVDRLTNFVTDLSNPDYFNDPMTASNKYRQFEYIQGIRIVVETMNKANSTFDLIELSPRLSANISDLTTNYSITKSASDLSGSALPVGQLLASTGMLQLFDYNNSFNINNPNSIIAKYTSRHLQIKFYEIIVNVNGYDYYIPIKTMYSEGFPAINANTRQVDITLRDLYFYFESITAPQMLIQDASLTYAVSLLLDSVGFSNYVFKFINNEANAIIPFFYIPPDKTVAEILNDLAVSTQTAMFFDEYNNFVMMSKNYIMPSETQRSIDMTLYGTQDFEKTGVYKNKPTSTKLANIIEVASQDNAIINDGRITYNTKHIQRQYGSIKQASMVDQDKTWIYQPALLWEATGTEAIKSVNQNVTNMSNFALAAIPLNTDLSSAVPTVVNRVVVNNTMDFGEGISWLTRYNGYFYANGEIIKFDAAQFNISGFGNVWITSTQEYQNYFSKLPFNGKIYPTGLIRIYSEPNYEEVGGVLMLKNGAVAKHGRGQFGTPIVSHNAGLASNWSDNAYVRACQMNADYLFTDKVLPATVEGIAGMRQTLANNTTRNGIIRNFLSSRYLTETEVNSKKSTDTGTVQSSALVMNGPSFATADRPLDYISYVYKPLNDRFKHFGTRMRIIGKIENSESRGQTPIGTGIYYTVTGTTPQNNLQIGGSSGGLAVMVNPNTNNGYYFELAALTANNIEAYSDQESGVSNVIFYKIKKDASSELAIPVKLWSGLAEVLVDSGTLVGQYRISGQDKQTVYDLGIEYLDIGNTRRFFLYINNRLIATVDDTDPLPKYNNMALFLRGSSRVMFENVYALTNNYSQNTAYALDLPINNIYSDSEINTNEAFRKYAINGVIQGTYLSGINPAEPPAYKMYFDEFGTIMREAHYFNVKYDKAFPALYAKLSPTFNNIKGYTVSGFRAGSYAAEFMVFNATDKALSLDSGSGNYLRIQGVTFTQQSQNDYTVDEYFTKNSNFSNPQFKGTNLISSPFKVNKLYEDIKISRLTHGKKDFSLNAPYIQSYDDAQNMMEWIISKISKPRKSIGLKMFAMPTLQLGDIVNIKFKQEDVDILVADTDRFVVYNIEYSKDGHGPNMTVFLSEVK